MYLSENQTNNIILDQSEGCSDHRRKGVHTMSHKYVYLFSEGNGHMRELLGGKGANLAEMTNLGMPVPQGFTITTEACTQYYKDDHQINSVRHHLELAADAGIGASTEQTENEQEIVLTIRIPKRRAP